ncbi:MAG: thioredoxin domain-containing protein, partial [Candidatus Aminicenantes bacterium]|nr:thioredoxin domain-containing protein [Candidatus Aminicenantes bacterium]
MKTQNRLAAETSPYLRQHAENPVDWYPWSDEAFARARAEDKPIFLSIGYSACHWCHVMERESFADPEAAALLNRAFVCVKVDREERPDIDGHFMTVCQALTGSGGWPLTIIMTPAGEPFFAATYIPKERRFGQPGLVELVPRLEEAWTKRRGEVIKTASAIAAAIADAAAGPEPAHDEVQENVLHVAAGEFEADFDEEHGGFGGAPKFPSPHNLMFLLRYARRTGNNRSLRMVERTLDAMRRGGIWDHLGGGFHRYTTDARWLVPHFEKMLYDQALLALAYLEAYQAMGRMEFARTARETLDYALRDMSSPEGGFYSAEDADSEGEEGKFYLWTLDETARVLSAEDRDLARRALGLRPEGNFRDPHNPGGRKNVLHLAEDFPVLAEEFQLKAQQVEERTAKIRA